MKLNIFIAIVILLVGVTQAEEQEHTHLTYFIEYEEQQEEDFIQVGLQIQAQSGSLVEALSRAQKVAAEVTNLANNYCKQYSKKGKDNCKEAVQVSAFDISPQYQTIRKEATFSKFVVSHEVTINVYYTDNIGYLIDAFLKYTELTLQGFEWKPLEEKDSEEQAIKQGLEQGDNLCQQVGLTLGRIIDIEEVIDEGDGAGEEGGEEGQEEQEQEPVEVTVYKFQVECVPKGFKAKAK